MIPNMIPGNPARNPTRNPGVILPFSVLGKGIVLVKFSLQPC